MTGDRRHEKGMRDRKHEKGMRDRRRGIRQEKGVVSRDRRHEKEDRRRERVGMKQETGAGTF